MKYSPPIPALLGLCSLIILSGCAATNTPPYDGGRSSSSSQQALPVPSLDTIGGSGSEYSSSSAALQQNDPPASSQPAKKPAAERLSIAIKNFAFSPANVSVPAGSTVTWTNSDTAPHTVTGDGIDSSTLTTGQAYSQTFDKAGTYSYHCSIHPTMQGAITVTE